jgi:ribonuclease HI
MSKINLYIIYTDGGARGNPGPAGIGYVIYDQDRKIVVEGKKYIGEATNNQAEYIAVLEAMRAARKITTGELIFYMDSELVMSQLSQKYKIKNTELRKLFVQIWNESQGFKKVSYHHVPREQNNLADSLVNQAIDEAMK